MRYPIIIESSGRNYAAYVPDLPGCVATGDTVEAVETAILQAIEMHLGGMREDGIVVPEPTCEAHNGDKTETSAADPTESAWMTLSTWDTREYLLTPQDVRGYIKECFASCEDDIVFLEHACRIAAGALHRMATQKAAAIARSRSLRQVPE